MESGATGADLPGGLRFVGFYQDRQHRPPPRAAPGTVLAVSCDAKGILVLPGQLRPEAARQARSPPAGRPAVARRGRHPQADGPGRS